MNIQPLSPLGVKTTTIGSGFILPIQLELDSAPEEASAYVSNFESMVVAACIIDPGRGYTSLPEISFDGGGGNGAAGTPIMVGRVKSVNFNPGPEVTPTVFTVSPSVTASPTCSNTMTPSITKTASSSPTPTKSVTPSITHSNTPSNTPTQTPTPTLTRTPTLTPSITPSQSPVIIECQNILNDSILFTAMSENSNNGGSGYLVAPNIDFEGRGIKAEAICDKISGFISSVDIAIAGEFYQEAPRIVVNGDGFGAKLVAKISGYIYRTFVSDPGLYPSGTVLSITPSSGNATFSGVMTAPDPDTGNISLLEVAIVDPGNSYDSRPSINIISNSETIRPAAAYCKINAGISEILVESPGVAFTKSPKISIIRNDDIAHTDYTDNKNIKFEYLTPTPTNTPTCTNTPTPSYSPTTTCTPTVSPTKTQTPTMSPTLTQSVSYSPTASITPSDPTNLVISNNSLEFTPTPTASKTSTPTTSITPSPTVTKTKTPTPTLTPTKTNTPTNTSTKTQTPTITKSYSPTATASPTPSITPSPSTGYPRDTVNYDAILIPRMSYSIRSLSILDPGLYDYGVTPTIKPIPAYTAAYKATIVNPGSGFTSTPSAKVIGSTVSSKYRNTEDPECLAVINFKIQEIEVINGGYNYSLPPKIVLHGGYDPIKGIKAECTAVVSDGVITSVIVDNFGDFYRSAPDIKILSESGSGYGAVLRTKLVGTLEDVYITNVGRNLTPNSPNKFIIFEGGGPNNDASAYITTEASGEGLNATANISYSLVGIEITEGGNNYKYPPEITISGGDLQKFNEENPKPAKAQARIEGLVRNIYVTNGGKNYGPCYPKGLGVHPIGSSRRRDTQYYLSSFIQESIPFHTGVFDAINSKFFESDFAVPNPTIISGIVTDNTDGLPKFNDGTNSGYYMPSSLYFYNIPFIEQPHIIFEDSYALSTKTYLEFAGWSTSSTGLLELIIPTTGLLSTNKRSIPREKLIPEEDYDNHTITSLYSPYANVGGASLGREHLYDNRKPPYVSFKGDIVGIDSRSTYNDTETGLGLHCYGFFDTLPTITIQDITGDGGTASLTQLENKLVRLLDHSGSISCRNISSGLKLSLDDSGDDYYSIFGYTSNSGINVRTKSNLTIDGTNYTTNSILVCESGGIPTSWNNPPTFNISISGGKIADISIVNSGLGFGVSLLGDNDDDLSSLVYFSGGGGSGGVAKLIADINNICYASGAITSKYELMGKIVDVQILNRGSGYELTPTPIIVDYSPTWDNIEINRKNYIANTIKYLNSSQTLSKFGILPTIDLLYTNAKPFETRKAKDHNYQISTGFNLSSANYSIGQAMFRGGLEFINDPTGSYFITHINPFTNGDILLNTHFYNGKIDEILIGYINGIKPFSHYDSNDIPNIRVANEAEISRSGIEIPTFEAFVPKWDKNIFSRTTLLRNFGAEG